MEGEAELQRESIREDSPERQKLKSWLNKSMKIKMGDGRTLIGVFVCTDKDQNVILGSCEEYIHEPGDKENEEQPRSLGLAMVPGPHIVSIHVDQPVEPPPKT